MAAPMNDEEIDPSVSTDFYAVLNSRKEVKN